MECVRACVICVTRRVCWRDSRRVAQVVIICWYPFNFTLVNLISAYWQNSNVFWLFGCSRNSISAINSTVAKPTCHLRRVVCGAIYYREVRFSFSCRCISETTESRIMHDRLLRSFAFAFSNDWCQIKFLMSQTNNRDISYFQSTGFNWKYIVVELSQVQS